MLGDSLGGEGGRSDYSRPGGRARPSHGVQPGGRSQERHQGTTSSVRRRGPSGKDHFKRAEISQVGAFPARAVMPHASCAEGESPRGESAQTPAVAGRPPCGRDAGWPGAETCPRPRLGTPQGAAAPTLGEAAAQSRRERGLEPTTVAVTGRREKAPSAEFQAQGRTPASCSPQGPGCRATAGRHPLSPDAQYLRRPPATRTRRWPSAVAVSTTSLPGCSCHRVNAGVAVRVRLRRTPSGVDTRREVRRS